MNGTQTRSPATPTQALSDRVLASLPYVSLLGLATLTAVLMLSFEEPHRALLLAAAVLVSAAPVGMLIHLAATAELTAAEKHQWVSGLTSRRGPALFAAYFRVNTRRSATRMLVGAERNHA